MTLSLFHTTMRETRRIEKVKDKTGADRWIGVLLIVVSAASFGALPIFTRLAYRGGAEPTTLLMLRFSIASVVMVAIMAVRRTPFPRGRILLVLVLMGGVGYVGQSLAYFTALTMVSAGLVALLLYLYPAIVTVLSVIFFKERLTVAKTGALVLALVGTAFTLGPTGSGRMLGIILAIASAVMSSVYIIVGSRIISYASAITASAVVMISAAVVYAGIVAVRGPVFPHTPLSWMFIFAIALVSTVLPIVTFLAGLERVGPTRASTISTFEPIVSVVLATVILGETFSLLQVLGGMLILAAVIVCNAT
jgi:drug/metabolite transporter (DMT)-like permease